MLLLVVSGGVAIYVYAGRIAASQQDRELIAALTAVRTLAETQGGLLLDVRRTFNDGRVYDTSSPPSTNVERKVADYGATLKTMDEHLSDVRKNSADTEKLQFYSALSTRVGAVLMLVFLAQFLIAAYRYTLRLAAAYDSRADALVLMWNPPEPIDAFRWVDGEAARRFMSVDDHSFERVKSPSKEALDLATAVLALKGERRAREAAAQSGGQNTPSGGG